MAVNITTNNNTVKVVTTPANKVKVVNNITNTSVTVTQPTPTQVVRVVTAGPQGQQGPAGAAGAIPNTGSFATTGSNTFIGNQTVSGSVNISGSLNTNNTLYVTGSRVGIGTTTPTDTLEVSGSGTFLESVSLKRNGAFGNPPRLIGVGQDGVSYTSIEMYDASTGGMALKSWRNGSIMSFNIGNSLPNLSEVMRITNTKNVLINTTTDAGFKLDVNGTVRFRAQGASSSDIAFRVRNSADTLDIIKANGAGDVFVGLAAGLNNTTGTNNTFIGIEAGRNNITSTSNTFIGAQAGINTTAGSNTFVGAIAGRDNISGGSNSFFGLQAGFFNTIGSSNVSIGRDAGLNNTTGGSNAFIGTSAGRYQSDGTTSLTIANNSVFIGFDTRANGNSQTNQIVIGHTAIGLGSNTVVLGNDSITTTALKGNVGIGASTPSSRLQVRGSGATTSTTALRVENTNASASLVVNDAGNVLVGTATDAGFKLDVNGTARVSNNLTILPSAGGTWSFGTGGSSSAVRYVDGVYTRMNYSSGIGRWEIDGGLQANTQFRLGDNISFSVGQINQSQVLGFTITRTFSGNVNSIGSNRTVLNLTNTFASPITNAALLRMLYINPDTTNWTTVNSIETVAGNVLLGTTSGSVGIGANTSINASAIVDITSTTQGFLPPRMTNAQRTSISSPAVGLMVYCTDATEGLYVYKSAGWTFIA